MVSIFDINNYEDEKLTKAISQILESTGYNFKGRKVLVKPNLLSAYPPERAATTHPAIVREIVAWLKKAGAEIVVSDNPGGSLRHHTVENVAKTTQIADASQGFFYPMTGNIVKVNAKSKFVNDFYISRFVLDADYLINVPKLKTHTFTLITGAIKNMFGIISGNFKMQLHSLAPTAVQFSTLLVDIYQVRIPDLNIVDAIVGMEGNGPNVGHVREVGKILASTNGVEVDAVIAKMMGITPKSVHMLLVANSRGLGEIDLNKIETLHFNKAQPPDWLEHKNYAKNIEKIRNWKMPMNTANLIHSYINPFASSLNVLPIVIKKKCKKCKICVDSCPVKNIKFNRYPIIKRKNCIHCYCCSELCPEGAIVIPSILQDLICRIFR